MNSSSQAFSQKVIDRLRAVLPARDGLPLHEPYFGGREWDYVKDCLDSGWVSSVGAYVNRFEKMLCDYTASPYAIAAVNGTAALHICLLLAGVEKGDEVLAPALTFVATANTIVYCSAVPHFVDSSTGTLGIDPYKLNEYLSEITEIKDGLCYNRHTGRPIRAVVPMHTFGHPVDVDPLLELCERYRLALVEDAAESLGSLYNNKHTGTFGRVACLSFNGNKIVTTGGGGAILTADSTLAARAKHLTTQAKMPHKWAFNHDQVAYNYRMPNLNAALGCAQLEQLPVFVEKKRALASLYSSAFQECSGAAIFREAEFARSNYWLNVLQLDEENSQCRDEILDLAHEAGIMLRPAWTLMHKLPMYETCPRMDLNVAESLARRIINLPSSFNLEVK